ncbi:MAG: TIGR00341 family protein [Patescibacteria group bacterium]
MNLRLVKIFLPLEDKTRADEILRESSIDEFWHDRISDRKVLIRALVLAEEIEEFLDKLEEEFSETEGFRTVILPVEASIPRLQEEKEKKAKEEGTSNNRERVSREELYSDISANSKLNWTYVTLIILASIVGSIGLANGNVPMVVGAMIIAPLLGPAVGLSLGTVLGDFKLTFESVKTLVIGILASLIFSILVGFMFDISPGAPEIAMRTTANFGDVIVSLSAGAVGALSFTTGTLTSLAGVMVAVSLLPPLVAVGMLLGAGFKTLAFGALLLFVINLISVNLAAVVTFSIQKISPRSSWQSLKAKFLTGLAIFIWFTLLLIAAGLIVYI